MNHNYFSELPWRGDFLTYCGSHENLTRGFDYKILNIQYEVIAAYEVLVEGDNGDKLWVLLNEFNWSE